MLEVHMDTCCYCFMHSRSINFMSMHFREPWMHILAAIVVSCTSVYVHFQCMPMHFQMKLLHISTCHEVREVQ